jgi:hypothetical protein
VRSVLKTKVFSWSVDPRPQSSSDKKLEIDIYDPNNKKFGYI